MASAPHGAIPDPYRTRRTIGFWLFTLGIVGGMGLLVLLFVLEPLLTPNPAEIYYAMVIGAALAFPAALMYLTVPRLMDRYDPEPWYALVGCLLWGGIAACGFSATINTGVMSVGSLFGPGVGDVLAAVVSAPIVEEFWKGVGVFGVFYFLRSEFDGVVDGIIYATFTALGFAAVENVIYYAQAAQQGDEILGYTFFLRGVLSPWIHPVYTAMTGIGFGIARESSSTATKILAPLGGYLLAVFFHAVWNGSATFGGGLIFVLLLPLWLIFVFGFVVMVIVMVRRFGRVIRENLLDEVAIGTIDQGELDLVCSAFGVLRARMEHGKKGEEFVRATARLGLSKWHTARAMTNRNQTVSMDFIVPLRRKIAELKASL